MIRTKRNKGSTRAVLECAQSGPDRPLSNDSTLGSGPIKPWPRHCGPTGGHNGSHAKCEQSNVLAWETRQGGVEPKTKTGVLT